MTQPGTPGRVLAGRYRLLEPVGRGGPGAVWRGHDGTLDRVVAVKEVALPAEATDDQRGVLTQRIGREARSAARLSHPHVVAVFDVVEEDDRPWIVGEFLPSRTLGQVVTALGPLSPHKAAGVGARVAGALRAAHAVDILHRDVKPGSVLLADSGRVALTGFGIGHVEGGGYLAPERARGNPSDAASDLWLLGATLYAAVEGRPPYQRADDLDVRAALVADDPDRPERAGPLWPVLAALLRRDPTARPDAAEAEALLRAVAAGGTASSPAGPARVSASRVDLRRPDRVLPLPLAIVEVPVKAGTAAASGPGLTAVDAPGARPASVVAAPPTGGGSEAPAERRRALVLTGVALAVAASSLVGWSVWTSSGDGAPGTAAKPGASEAPTTAKDGSSTGSTSDGRGTVAEVRNEGDGSAAGPGGAAQGSSSGAVGEDPSGTVPGGSTGPGGTDPGGSTGPGGTDPGGTDPGGTDPGGTDPGGGTGPGDGTGPGTGHGHGKDKKKKLKGNGRDSAGDRGNGTAPAGPRGQATRTHRPRGR